MKPGDIRPWRSPVARWWLFALFAILTIVWQLVDVKPYPHRHRDWLVGTIVLGGATTVCLILACRARKSGIEE